MFIPEGKPSWVHLLFKVRGSVLPRIWVRCTVVTAIAVLNTALRERWNFYAFSLTTAPFVMIGLPLGIFLGFRNGASYDRFWEGRKLWGALVNTSRSLARQLSTLVGPLDGDRPRAASGAEAAEVRAFQHEMIRRVLAFVHASRVHLRQGRDFDPAADFLPEDERPRLVGERNVPIVIVHRMGERLRDAWARGFIHAMHVPILEASFATLTDIQGACERIKTTPIPFSYTVLIHRLVGIYCFLLPFGVVETIHWATPVVVLFVSYAFFGLDQIGDEIEDPFGSDLNDLPLEAISRTIEINLRQRLGDEPLPEPIRPIKGVLL